MGFYPRDVPEYSDIVFHFKDNLLLEADGRGSKTNSRSRSYGSTSKRTNPLDIRVSDGDREGFMFPSNINSNESNYFSDSTDGEEQFSPRTQENMKRIDMIKHALRTGMSNTLPYEATFSCDMAFRKPIMDLNFID